MIIFPYRVNSVKNLNQIAVALGQDRARNELLPYILGKSNDLKLIIMMQIEISKP